MHSSELEDSYLLHSIEESEGRVKNRKRNVERFDKLPWRHSEYLEQREEVDPFLLRQLSFPRCNAARIRS